MISDPVEPGPAAIPAPDPADRRRFSGRLALLAVAVVATLWLTILVHHAELEVALIAVAGVACAVLAILERRTPALPVSVVAVAIGVILAAAVIAPSRSSKDLWSYAMYGRMVAVHT